MLVPTCKPKDRHPLLFPSTSRSDPVLILSLPQRDPSSKVTRETPDPTAPPTDSPHTSGWCKTYIFPGDIFAVPYPCYPLLLGTSLFRDTVTPEEEAIQSMQILSPLPPVSLGPQPLVPSVPLVVQDPAFSSNESEVPEEPLPYHTQTGPGRSLRRSGFCPLTRYDFPRDRWYPMPRGPPQLANPSYWHYWGPWDPSSRRRIST